MKKSLCISLLLFTALVSEPVMSSNYSALDGIKGQRYSDLEKYKSNCSACMNVVRDIINIRYQACGQSVSDDDVIIRDPLYGYLNSINFMIGENAYNKILTIFREERDCTNSLNWLDNANKKIEPLLNKPK
uniref:hypothetical protein n=1 Tax=Photorhabdus sp. RM322S TaxID=3342825 RepID=UPI0036D80353